MICIRLNARYKSAVLHLAVTEVLAFSERQSSRLPQSSTFFSEHVWSSVHARPGGRWLKGARRYGGQTHSHTVFTLYFVTREKNVLYKIKQVYIYGVGLTVDNHSIATPHSHDRGTHQRTRALIDARAVLPEATVAEKFTGAHLLGGARRSGPPFHRARLPRHRFKQTRRLPHLLDLPVSHGSTNTVWWAPLFSPCLH